MKEPQTFSSTALDGDLERIAKLQWLPWVGGNYANLPQGRRVLVVCESHYSPFQDAQEAAKDIAEYMADRLATRKQVEQTLIACDWTTPTLTNLYNLLYSPENRTAFWADLCLYNFIQRPMHYRHGSPERPLKDDFHLGWEVFFEVIGVLQPDHVLFVGVEASNQFNDLMKYWEIPHTPIEALDWINSTHTRRAMVNQNGREVALHFIKHCGSYFSTDRWRDYLQRHARPMMESIAVSARASLPVVAGSMLHVFGMAKSSLDHRGAKASKLELDFLRLVYAVREFRDAGKQAVGYLMVLDPQVQQTAMKWIERYHSGDAVSVLCIELSPEDRAILEAEKAGNAKALLPDDSYRISEKGLSLALALCGKEYGEDFLKKDIESRHPGVTTSSEQPFDIRWDYYGILSPEGLNHTTA